MSSACEVDICGVVGMHALALASGTPSALLDWNNNYGDDPDKAVCFHCSNLPKHFFADVQMDFQAIIAGTVGKENTFGTCVGRVKAGADELRPLLHRRSSRQDPRLCWRGRVHRRSARDLRRRGRRARSRSCRICCATSARTASSITSRPTLRSAPRVVHEAATQYLGWDMYWHKQHADAWRLSQALTSAL